MQNYHKKAFPSFLAVKLFPFLTPRILADLEWKIIYVGSAESEEFDQILDSVLVGPVPAGRHMFVFQVRKTWPWALTPRNSSLTHKHTDGSLVQVQVQILAQLSSTI